MAKAAWGLSAWLIGEKSYDAVQGATGRHELVGGGPGGSSGDACDGGCSPPIGENGCGGMNDKVGALRVR